MNIIEYKFNRETTLITKLEKKIYIQEDWINLFSTHSHLIRLNQLEQLQRDNTLYLLYENDKLAVEIFKKQVIEMEESQLKRQEEIFTNDIAKYTKLLTMLANPRVEVVDNTNLEINNDSPYSTIYHFVVQEGKIVKTLHKAKETKKLYQKILIKKVDLNKVRKNWNYEVYTDIDNIDKAITLLRNYIIDDREQLCVFNANRLNELKMRVEDTKKIVSKISMTTSGIAK